MKMTENSIAVIQSNEQQDKRSVRGVRFPRYTDDGVALHGALT
jgi:hypothetical protein